MLLLEAHLGRRRHGFGLVSWRRVAARFCFVRIQLRPASVLSLDESDPSRPIRPSHARPYLSRCAIRRLAIYMNLVRVFFPSSLFFNFFPFRCFYFFLQKTFSIYEKNTSTMITYLKKYLCFIILAQMSVGCNGRNNNTWL